MPPIRAKGRKGRQLPGLELPDAVAFAVAVTVIGITGVGVGICPAVGPGVGDDTFARGTSKSWTSKPWVTLTVLIIAPFETGTSMNSRDEVE